MPIFDAAQVLLQTGVNQIQTGEAYDWALTQITGHTFMVADVSIGQYADRDGGYEKKTRYLPREITMYIRSKLGSAEQIQATWRLLRNYMNAHNDAALTLTDIGMPTLHGSGKITEVKKRDEENMKWTQRADIKVVFTMFDPWYSSESISRPFNAETPLFMFPFTIMAEGFTTGIIAAGNELTFDVLGDDAPGFLFTMNVTGSVVNPTLTNQDGLYIKAVGSFTTGDVLTFSTRDKPFVRCNGATQKRDRGSKFFSLALGSNTLTVSADSGANNMTKLIEYQERYQ